MYANKVSVALSEKDCLLKFDYVGPNLKMDGTIESVGVIDNQIIIMDKDMLKKLRDIINYVLSSNNDQEKKDENQ